MKKNYFLLILLTLVGNLIYSQSTAVIGTPGTTANQGLPVEPYYGYTYSQSIITAAELNAAGIVGVNEISALTLDYTSTSLNNSDDWTVYVGHTTKSTFSSSTDWEPVAFLTSVFSGTATVTTGTPNTVTITFSTPFMWDGTSNLIFAFDENATSYGSSSDDFLCRSTTGTRSLCYRSDPTNPDPASPPSASFQRSYVPNMSLTYTPQQGNVVIGTPGTSTTQTLPIEPYYGYSYSQSIFPVSELNAAGIIGAKSLDTLTFEYTSSNLNNSDDWTVYMGHTTKSSFSSSTDWEALTNLSQVFSGTASVTLVSGSNNLVKIALTTPFIWNGVDNIIIAVDENATSYGSSSDDFYCRTTTGTRSIIYRSDPTNPDPASPPAASFQRTAVPNLSIAFSPAPSCNLPIGIAFSGITTSGANVAWTHPTSTSFKFEYGVSGFTQGTGVTDTTSSLSSMLSGLAANTTYDFYVQAYCGTSDSSGYSGPFSFTTLCSAATLPYLQDFSSWPPTCWDLTGGTNNWISYTGGIARANFWSISSGTLHMMSEPIIVSSNARLKFDWSRNTSSFYDDSVAVQVREVGGAWNTVWGMTSPSSNDGANNTSPGSFVTETIILDSATYTNKTIQVRFVGVSDWGPDFFVDNVIVEAIPNCPDPTALNAFNVMSTSAMINWSNNAGSANSRIEYGTAGFVQGTGTSVIVTNDTVSLSGLNAFTTYQYYVTSLCTASDSSPWAGPYSFTTLCNDTNVGPWSDNVEGHGSTSVITGIANCWSGTKTGTSFEWEITNSGTTGSSGTGANSANSGSNYFYTEASGAGIGDTTILESPSVDLSSLTTPFLEFYYHMYGNQIGSLSVEVFDGTTWTNELTLTGAQQATQASAWNQQYIDLSSYSGVVKMRFIAVSNGSWEGDICLDDISVIESPACFSPTMAGVTVNTSTTATLSWSAPLFGSPTSYIVKYDTAGFDPLTTGTTIVASGLNTSLTGLTAKTNYDYYVRSYCGGTDSSAWVGPISFYTWYCVPAPSSVDGLGITNVTIGTINNTTGSETGNYGDYDSLSTDIIQGAPAQAFSIQYSTGYTYGTKIWIDWNDDLVFDSTEQVYFGLSASSNPTVLSGTFAIPTTAPLGSHIMRIGGTDNNLGPNSPCYTGSYGSFEDYTVNVIPPCYVSAVDTYVVCDSMMWMDGITYTASNNTAIDTLKSNVAGICDTIFTLDLTVKNSTTFTDTHVVCDSLTWLDGVTYTASNTTATHIIPNSVGCDSVITLNLTVNYSKTFTNVVTACESYTLPGGRTMNYTGSFTDTIPTTLGCDSIITTLLTVNYNAAKSISVTACGSYTSPSGKVWTTSGTRYDTIPTSKGCDSLMTINLTIKANSSETRTVSACESYTVPETGNTYFVSGTYTDLTTNAFGCIKTITTILTVNSVTALPVTVSGITLTAPNTGVTYKWMDCENAYSYLLGETGQTFTPVRNGEYAVEITSVDGCKDTSICTPIMSVSLDEYVVSASDINVYPNPASSVVSIDIAKMNPNENVTVRIFDAVGKLIESSELSASNNLLELDVTNLAEGIYTISVSNDYFSTSKKLTVVK